MKTLLKWVAWGLGALVALAVLALGVVYALSARIINRTYDVPAVAVAVPVGPVAVAEGKRLATIRGCNTCHMPNLEGQVFVDDPLLARLASPNLSRLVPAYSDAELELLVRHGVRKNGRSVVAMPSSMFARLSDADLGAIIAYLRSVPPVDHDLPTTRIGPLARIGLVLGKYHTEASVIDQQAPHPAVAPVADRLAYGKYLALTSCTECHGPDLKGRPDGSRNLAVVAGYSDSAFHHFFRTGMALGNRRLERMSEMVERRFKHFTDIEVGALHAYLRTLGGAEAGP